MRRGGHHGPPYDADGGYGAQGGGGGYAQQYQVQRLGAQAPVGTGSDGLRNGGGQTNAHVAVSQAAPSGGYAAAHRADHAAAARGAPATAAGYGAATGVAYARHDGSPASLVSGARASPPLVAPGKGPAVHARDPAAAVRGPLDTSRSYLGHRAVNSYAQRFAKLHHHAQGEQGHEQRHQHRQQQRQQGPHGGATPDSSPQMPMRGSQRQGSPSTPQGYGAQGEQRQHGSGDRGVAAQHGGWPAARPAHNEAYAHAGAVDRDGSGSGWGGHARQQRPPVPWGASSSPGTSGGASASAGAGPGGGVRAWGARVGGGGGGGGGTSAAGQGGYAPQYHGGAMPPTSGPGVPGATPASLVALADGGGRSPGHTSPANGVAYGSGRSANSGAGGTPGAQGGYTPATSGPQAGALVPHAAAATSINTDAMSVEVLAATTRGAWEQVRSDQRDIQAVIIAIKGHRLEVAAAIAERQAITADLRVANMSERARAMHQRQSGAAVQPHGRSQAQAARPRALDKAYWHALERKGAMAALEDVMSQTKQLEARLLALAAEPVDLDDLDDGSTSAAGRGRKQRRGKSGSKRNGSGKAGKASPKHTRIKQEDEIFHCRTLLLEKKHQLEALKDRVEALIAEPAGGDGGDAAAGAGSNGPSVGSQDLGTGEQLVAIGDTSTESFEMLEAATRLQAVEAKEAAARQRLGGLVGGLHQLYRDATQRRAAADHLQHALTRRRQLAQAHAQAQAQAYARSGASLPASREQPQHAQVHARA